MSDARALLRAAIEARATAIDARTAAAGAMRRADAVRAAARAAFDRADESSREAAAARSGEVADAIRDDVDPMLALGPKWRDVGRERDEAESHLVIAEGAHDRLGGDLAKADAALSRAKSTVDRAALAVIVDEVGTNIAPVIVPSFDRLCEAFDTLTALTMLSGDVMSPQIRAAAADTARLASFIDLGRAQRAGNQARPVDEALSKLNTYLVDLAADADATFDAIVSTAPPRVPSLPATDVIGIARESAHARVLNG